MRTTDGRTERPNHAACCQGFEMSPTGWMNSYLDLSEDQGMKPNRNMPDLGHRRERERESLRWREGRTSDGRHMR